MSASSRRARISLAALLLLASGATAGMLLAPPAQADDSSQGGGNVSVTIDDGSTPSPSASATLGGADESGRTPPPSTVGGSGGGSTTTTSGGAGSSGGGATTESSGGTVVGGILYMGGLASQGEPAANPAEGSVSLWFSVRNISKSTIDADVTFWVSNALGVQLDAYSTRVAGLAPGATQVVTAKLHHIGQWGLVNAHATLTPPATVDGRQVAPVTRDAVVFVFPWLGPTPVAAVGGSFLAWALVRRLFPTVIAVSTR